MTVHAPNLRAEVVRWVRAVPFIFLLIGLSFGTWLSRLPSIRDQLGASAAQMGIYGLCLAAGSVVALVISGRLIHHYGPKRVLIVVGIATAVTLPAAAAVLLGVSIPAGLAILFLFGFSFSIADVAICVSGANAEAAYGKPCMPLMHGGYSLGAVAATGIGALAEALAVPVALHFAAIMAICCALLLFLVRFMPADELATRKAATGAAGADSGADSIDRDQLTSSDQTPLATHTGSIPVIDQRSYSPWLDPRIIVIGIIALSFGIFEGTAADWLPLALVDGRDFGNDLGTAMLSVFYCSALVARLIGSWLLGRFGRVPVLCASAVLAALGVTLVIAVPGPVSVVVGVIAWGLGGALGWPIALSAAADNPETAARSVGTVAALGYGSMLLGPLAFGFLGDRFGLLTAFWALVPFAIYVVVSSRVVRPLGTVRELKG